MRDEWRVNSRPQAGNCAEAALPPPSIQMTKGGNRTLGGGPQKEGQKSPPHFRSAAGHKNAAGEKRLRHLAEVKRFELLRRRSRPTGFRIMLLTRNMTESRRRKMYLMEPETHLKNGRLFSSLCFFSRNLVNRKWIEQQDITAPNF